MTLPEQESPGSGDTPPEELDRLIGAARVFDGQLTATVHGSGQEPVVSTLVDVLTERVGRVVWNGWPTGVSVTYAQHHGGPPLSPCYRPSARGLI